MVVPVRFVGPGAAIQRSCEENIETTYSYFIMIKCGEGTDAQMLRVNPMMTGSRCCVAGGSTVLDPIATRRLPLAFILHYPPSPVPQRPGQAHGFFSALPSPPDDGAFPRSCPRVFSGLDDHLDFPPLFERVSCCWENVTDWIYLQFLRSLRPGCPARSWSIQY